MIILKEEVRFADAEDEDIYQGGRKNPIIRDSRTCALRDKEVEESNSVKFEPPLYIQRYAKVTL